MIDKLSKYWIESNKTNLPLTDKQKNSLKVFLRSLNINKIKEAIDITNAREIEENNERFRYLCGILNNWKKERIPGNAEIMEIVRYWNKKRPQRWKKAEDDEIRYLLKKFDIDKIKLYIDLTIKENRGWTHFSDIKDNLESGKYE